MTALAEQKTLSEVLKEVTRLQNQAEADKAYIKALQEQCKLAHELIAEYKKINSEQVLIS